jgi:uncharacterized membrane protein YtjA (UPF0391 family)
VAAIAAGTAAVLFTCVMVTFAILWLRCAPRLP